jgi:hypothetical protein
MVIPVLRETRMPAVVCEVGPSDRLVERAPAVVNAVAEAVVSWATAGPA